MNDPQTPAPDDAALAATPLPMPSPPVVALSPAERLEASRARLRKSWLREPSTAEATDADHDADDGSTLLRMRRLAAAGWAKHPLKGSFDTMSIFAGPAVSTALGPIVRSHPLRLLAIAAVVGGALAWLRPWRLLPHAALSSVLISAVLPRAAIARYVVSGRWIKLMRAENFERWFRPRPTRARATTSANAAPSRGGDKRPTSQPLSDTAAPVASTASYARQAVPPIAAANAAP